MEKPDTSLHASPPGGSRRRRWYQLEDRHGALLPLRAAVIVAAAAVAASGAVDDMDVRDRELAVAMCVGALLAHLALWWVPSRWPRSLLSAVETGLVVDAALVFGLASVSGGRESPAFWLLPITTLAVTLAISVRSGVKAAVLAGIACAGVAAIDPDGALGDMAGPLILSIAMVVVAGTLARVNERELTRRGQGMTALHEASVAFVGVDDQDALSRIAAESVGALLPGWSVEVLLDGVPTEERAAREGRVAHLVVPVVGTDDEGAPVAAGAIHARRPAPRFGSVRLHVGSQLVYIRTLALALSSALRQAELVRRLGHLSLADALTGLGNRRSFDENLEQEVARAHRTGTPLGLVLLDVDHFKRFNDTHGHQAGDAALVAVAGVLRAEARTMDRPCRVGGEEFALLLPGADDAAAVAVAERIRLHVAVADAPAPVTVSLGVASSTGENDAAALYATADARLYAAKEGGRNRVVGVTPAP